MTDTCLRAVENLFHFYTTFHIWQRKSHNELWTTTVWPVRFLLQNYKTVKNIRVITQGSVDNDFGYNEHAAITSVFFLVRKFLTLISELKSPCAKGIKNPLHLPMSGFIYTCSHLSGLTKISDFSLYFLPFSSIF